VVNRLEARLRFVDDISVRLEAVEASSSAPRISEPASPNLSTYVEPFFAWREGIGTRHQVIGQERGTIARFIELHGDKPVDSYVRSDVVSFLNVLRKLPKTYGKSRKDKDTSLAEFLKRADDAGGRGLLDKTVKRHLSVLSQFFRFCVDKGGLTITQRNELCEKHRFQLSDLADSEQRDAWKMADLKILFASEIWSSDRKRDCRFWLPLLALYHGARLEESADLSRGDVFLDDISGLNAIRITPYVDGAGRKRTLKTRASKRTIPLHPELIKIGFLAYVEAVARKPFDPIFPDLPPQGPDGRRGARLTRWFVEYRKKLGIYRAGVGMHAFRHTVATALNDHVTTVLQKRSLDYLTGHAAQGSEGSVRYDKGPGLKLVHETLCLLEYPELDFSHLHL
jgi:integrase